MSGSKKLRDEIINILDGHYPGNRKWQETHADAILSKFDFVIEEILPKYNPNQFDFYKHVPNEEEVIKQKYDLDHYNKKLEHYRQKKANGYDFNRGWEYGEGFCLSQIKKNWEERKK